MGEFISTRTHPLQGQIGYQKMVVIKPNYFPLEQGLTPGSGHKVTKGIDSNDLDVIKASDFFHILIQLDDDDDDDDDDGENGNFEWFSA